MSLPAIAAALWPRPGLGFLAPGRVGAGEVGDLAMADLALSEGAQQLGGTRSAGVQARPPDPAMERVCALKVAAPGLQLTSIMTIPLPL
ncbi:MAG: hypothetical protein A2885_05635 [Sphingopyxis sp. RIFCSPHIGHO2_01_FULL_65_24]|nr:MAG: hypothetical protein A2885_05635 [Sphingopyxis sp. RIFCSPHIGHO2_01_FULL_65_24]